ncbi:unnamed protein product [Lactuca virosa]|uniref:RNA-dependent RNA polymerase n=1 Tax=Lactuca virosa TaxID=75947 RepID=A0AAU9MYT4_9ASTR|nr:unnamed protein product [Lactuca virosa]
MRLRHLFSSCIFAPLPFVLYLRLYPLYHHHHKGTHIAPSLSLSTPNPHWKENLCHLLSLSPPAALCFVSLRLRREEATEPMLLHVDFLDIKLKTVFADRELEKAMAPPCIELAKLFSVAVDFPKTRVPAEIPANLRVKEYPDFMEKSNKTTYESYNVIGKLFREVKDIAPQNSQVNPFTRDVARQTYDVDLEVSGFEYYVDEAFDFKTEYDYKLGNLMDYYGIKTEAELLSGSIMKMSRSFDGRNGLAVKSLRKEARNWFWKGRGNVDVGDDDVYAKASAWYHVTYHPDYWGKYNEDMKTRDHFLSFPWCVHDKLIEIKRSKGRVRRNVDTDWLQQQFSTALNLI